jgi:HAMP domain-containing protein
MMLGTRVMTGLWGLVLVNAVLLFIQVSTNLALRLI